MAFFCWRVNKKKWKLVGSLLLLANVSYLVLRFFSPLLPPNQPRVIGYACQRRRGCGGWADRQKGIVAAYVLAVILNQEFKILMPSPCELSFFLSPPGSVDWRLQPKELDGPHVVFLDYMNSNGLDFAKSFSATKDPLTDLFNAEYTFLSTNIELVQFFRRHRLAEGISWLQEKSIPEVYRHVLTELFDMMPGPRLQLKIFWDSVPPNKSLVCAQIRMGGGADTESFNTMEQLPGLVDFLAAYNTSSHRYMFTSDNTALIRHLQSYFPNLTTEIEGPVTHVDRSTGYDVCGGFQRAILEQLILSTCDVLVISESGMGKIASFLRHTDKDLYIFHDGKVESFSRLQNFPNRKSW